MTSGSAETADGPPGSSSSTPTDGPSSGLLTTDETFPIKLSTLTEKIEESFRIGWETARQIPGMDKPPPLTFLATIDRESGEVNIKTVIP